MHVHFGANIMTSENLANAGPLGLLGFSLTTILLSVHNLGFFGLDKTILAAAICLGGLAQIFAGMIEFKRSKMFTATVFTYFGLFWVTFALINTEMGILKTVDHTSMATFFLLISILALIFLLGTLKSPKVLQLAFLVLTITLFVLTIGAYTEIANVTKVGGALGVITGAIVLYIAAAEILNEQYQKPILPLF